MVRKKEILRDMRERGRSLKEDGDTEINNILYWYTDVPCASRRRRPNSVRL
jgi:hypothetical protein